MNIKNLVTLDFWGDFLLTAPGWSISLYSQSFIKIGFCSSKIGKCWYAKVSIIGYYAHSLKY